MDYATGCWSVPDIHNRQGQHATPERLIRRRVTALERRSSARAAGQSRRRDRPVKLGGIVVHLAADRGAALGAHVVVLAAGGQDEQELLAGRGGAAAAWTEEAGRLELLEAVPRRSHRRDSTPGL